MAHASLGMLRLHQGKFAEARASLERAVQSNSQNYLIHYYYAYVLSRSGAGAGEVVQGYSPETATKIYDELQRVIELRPDYPESYSLLGFVSLVTGKRVEEALTLLKRAVAATPGRNDLLFTMAQLYLRTSDYKMAKQLLEQVSKSSAEEELRQHAQTLLAQVTSIDEQQNRSSQSNTRNTNDSAPESASNEPAINVSPSAAPTPPPTTDPSSYLREVLRPVAAGETQVQGILLRIECEGKIIVFVVKVGDKVLRLKTNSFDDVEITTYNPDVKG